MNVSLWSADYEVALVCMLLPFINGVVCEPWLSTNNGCLRGVEIGWAIRAATCFLIAHLRSAMAIVKIIRTTTDRRARTNIDSTPFLVRWEHQLNIVSYQKMFLFFPPLLQVQRLNSMSEGQLSLDDHCSRSACHDGKTTNSWRSMLLKNPLLLSMVHYLVLLITHVVLFRYLQTYTIAYVRVSI